MGDRRPPPIASRVPFAKTKGIDRRTPGRVCRETGEIPRIAAIDASLTDPDDLAQTNQAGPNIFVVFFKDFARVANKLATKMGKAPGTPPKLVVIGEFFSPGGTLPLGFSSLVLAVLVLDPARSPADRCDPARTTLGRNGSHGAQVVGNERPGKTSWPGLLTDGGPGDNSELGLPVLISGLTCND
jgi:hypothetical protein